MSSQWNIISLGAGVQSSTMALMAAHGEITPMPDCAIFADTQWEPRGVYEWLDWLEHTLPFPVSRVTAGSLGDHNLVVRKSGRSGNTYTKSLIPVFIDKLNGTRGMFPRKCTRDYKLTPIIREITLLVTPRRKETDILVRQWIGISRDEAHRMKPAMRPWIENFYPLVDNAITRSDCLTWMEKHKYPSPPRSACVFCPYHSDDEWIRLKTKEPTEFERAAAWEEKYQGATTQDTVTNGVPFLHDSLVPLRDVEFVGGSGKADQFGNECEGMCGA